MKPMIRSNVVNINRQIIQPVVEQLTERIFNKLNMLNMFRNNINYMSNVEKSSKLSTDVKLDTDIRLDVIIDPNYNPKDQKFNSDIVKFIHNDNHHNKEISHPICKDVDTDTYMRRYDMSTSINVTYRMRFSNPTMAEQAMMTLRNVYGCYTKHTFNRFSYWYTIPHVLLNNYYDFYIQYIDNANVYENFIDYLRFISTGMIDIVENRYTGHKELCIHTFHDYVLGMIEYEASAPDVENKDQVVKHTTVEFSFAFQFACPDILEIEYPNSVSGVLIDKKYRYMNTEIVNKPHHDDVVINNCMTRESTDGLHMKYSHNVIVYPSDDSWRTDVDVVDSYRSLCPIFQCIVGNTYMDDTNKEHVSIDTSCIVKMLNHFYNRCDYDKSIPYFIKPISTLHLFNTRSPYVIKMFVDGIPYSDKDVEIVDIDGTIHIRLKEDTELYENTICRFVLYLNFDMELMRDEDIVDILNHVESFGPIIYKNLGYLTKHGFVSKIKPNVYKIIKGTRKDLKILYTHNEIRLERQNGYK